jgi:hypothetical protein
MPRGPDDAHGPVTMRDPSMHAQQACCIVFLITFYVTVHKNVAGTVY